MRGACDLEENKAQRPRALPISSPETVFCTSSVWFASKRNALQRSNADPTGPSFCALRRRSVALQ
jgi:hypothetical protein